MKIAVAAVVFCVLLSGCTPGDDMMDQAMTLRQQLLTSESCSFHAEITADYSDAIYTFQMDLKTLNLEFFL